MSSLTVIAGRYQIKRKIGSGSFGEVHIGISDYYIGSCVDTGEEVAIKLVYLTINIRNRCQVNTHKYFMNSS